MAGGRHLGDDERSDLKPHNAMKSEAPSSPEPTGPGNEMKPGVSIGSRSDAADAFAFRLMGAPFETLGERARKVAHHIAARTPISRPFVHDIDAAAPLGQRAADKVASFGGSWTFVGLFAVLMLGWVGLNAALLMLRGSTFDPYPYILLNLFLSMLAAIQAPVILMSQNRQSERDRAAAGHDYEVNLKAELEIMLLHEKIDSLRERQWSDLMAIQSTQSRLLAQLVERADPRTCAASGGTATP